MKRKVLSLILAVVLLSMSLLLSSCENAESLVTKALEKTQALDSYEVKTTVEMGISAQGTKVDVSVAMDLKTAGLKGENPVCYAKTDVSAMGQKASAETYVEGEWVYAKTEGVGTKMKLEDVQEEFDFQGEVEEMTKMIPADLLKDLEITENSDGSKTVTVAIPENRFSDIFEDMLKSIQESAVSQGNVDSVEIKEPVVTVTVKGGYVAVYDIDFKMAITVQGTTMNCDVSASSTFINPGEDVTVTPISGYQNFPEQAA